MRLFLLSVITFFTLTAHAGNLPCSGNKGGIERCIGAQFLCRDGSISASKRVCSTSESSAQSLKSTPPAPAASGSCHCRDGQYCTGPRGGTFCYSDSGKKSYRGK
ncbi:hypothetical protein [Achromobacter sp. NCFB-sbj8-Ac1-l]|uniref:hypothetical protein n=1 Tax=unclassified Achromobacter TaxID=2626865 RepID=UPI004046AA27